MADLDSSSTVSQSRVPAMQHLSHLQYQLTALRSLLPASAAPFLSSHVSPSPEILYAHFASSATSALTTIKEFRAAWEDDETVRVLREVRESLVKSGREGVEGRWWDSGLILKKDDMQRSVMHVVPAWQAGPVHYARELAGTVELEQNMLADVNAFKARTGACTVDYQSPDIPIKVGVTSGMARLNFSIERTITEPGYIDYQVSITGTSKLQKSITSCLKSRPHKGDLSATLDCLAAYTDLGSKKCDKCKRLFDQSALVATGRRRSLTLNSRNEDDDWYAFHEHCLP